MEFRRGATHELLQRGAALDVIKGSWRWLGAGYRRYVEVEMRNAVRLSRLLVTLRETESPGGGPDAQPWKVGNAKKPVEMLQLRVHERPERNPPPPLEARKFFALYLHWVVKVYLT